MGQQSQPKRRRRTIASAARITKPQRGSDKSWWTTKAVGSLDDEAAIVLFVSQTEDGRLGGTGARVSIRRPADPRIRGVPIPLDIEAEYDPRITLTRVVASKLLRGTSAVITTAD